MDRDTIILISLYAVFSIYIFIMICIEINVRLNGKTVTGEIIERRKSLKRMLHEVEFYEEGVRDTATFIIHGALFFWSYKIGRTVRIVFLPKEYKNGTAYLCGKYGNLIFKILGFFSITLYWWKEIAEMLSI
jgi:hypothetical protein